MAGLLTVRPAHTEPGSCDWCKPATLSPRTPLTVGSTSASIRTDYTQFQCDGVRVRIVIDDVPLEDCDNPHTLYTLLVNAFDNPEIGLRAVYWCTQTALASHYTRKALTLSHSFLHLIDSGGQQVRIWTGVPDPTCAAGEFERWAADDAGDPDAGDTWTVVPFFTPSSLHLPAAPGLARLTITKPFRISCISDGSERVLARLQLRVAVRWNSDSGPRDGITQHLKETVDVEWVQY